MPTRKNIGRIDEDFLADVDSAAVALGQTRMKFVRLALEARLAQLRGPGLPYKAEATVEPAESQETRSPAPPSEKELVEMPPERFDAYARARMPQPRPIVQKKR